MFDSHQDCSASVPGVNIVTWVQECTMSINTYYRENDFEVSLNRSLNVTENKTFWNLTSEVSLWKSIFVFHQKVETQHSSTQSTICDSYRTKRFQSQDFLRDLRLFRRNREVIRCSLCHSSNVPYLFTSHPLFQCNRSASPVCQRVEPSSPGSQLRR